MKSMKELFESASWSIMHRSVYSDRGRSLGVYTELGRLEFDYFRAKFTFWWIGLLPWLHRFRFHRETAVCPLCQPLKDALTFERNLLESLHVHAIWNTVASI